MFSRLQIATDIENLTNVTDQRTLVNHAIQIALHRSYQYFDNPFYLQDKGVIKTTNDYTTGTCAVTNGSATVTGTGTTWTAGMVGRKFRFQGEDAFYRIKTFTSTTEIVLEHPYQGSTDTSGTYAIYQDEYRLAPDVDKYKTLRQLANNITLFGLHPSRFDEIRPMPNAYGDPYYEIMEGSLPDTYTTGTLSGSVNTSVLTGSGTSWTGVEGLGRGSNIQVGANIYTVKTVDSDTQITIFESLSSAIAASTSYTIILNNLRVQLFNIPDAQKLIYYRYYRKPDPAVTDNTIPDMPPDFHWVLVYGAASLVFIQKGDINKAQIEAETRFMQGLEMMKQKLSSYTPDRVYQRLSVDRFRQTRGLNEGLESGNFDRRYSM